MIGDVYKVYKKYPKVNSDGHCGENQLCRCFGEEYVISLENLLIYDMVNDPYENNPLPQDSTR